MVLKSFPTIMLFFFLVFCGLCLNLHDVELERGHATAFYHSLFEDGDLNIVNQLNKNEHWLVTKNLNHPTHLNHGTVVFWAPFYLYSDLILKINNKLKIVNFDSYQIMAVVRNALFALLGIQFILASLELILKNQKNISNVKTILLVALSVLLATPLFWFVCFAPFTTEVTMFFLGALWIYWVLKFPLINQKNGSLFFSGLFLGIATVSKITFFVFVIVAVLDLLREKTVFLYWKTNLLRLSFLLLGTSLPLFLLGFNNYIQYGDFIIFYHVNVLNWVQTSENLIFQNFFLSPASFWMCSPIIFFTLLITAFYFTRNILINRLKDSSLFIHPLEMQYSVYLLVNIFLLIQVGFIILQPDLIISRIYSIFFPILTISVCMLWNQSGKYVKGLITFFLLVCIWVNWGHIAQFYRNGIIFESGALQSSLKTMFIGILAHIKIVWDQKSTFSNLTYFLPILFLAAIFCKKFSTFLSFQKIERLRVFFLSFFLLAFISYVFITVLNFKNNNNNVMNLYKSGFFRESVVSGGSNLNYYDEVMSIFESGFSYFPEKSKQLLLARDAYLKAATQEIIRDPIGLNKDLKAGLIRPSLWKMK